ncbi:UDP-N-acetylmuramoylalanyl-D-glutamyl-2,6-diaminopimelate--D-alanyl-D-alanine ligase [Ensifer soli]|uniref:UDP-N-acetylmuramoylalanyl-D-glutamyl-2, 6-diaminopimelate--D-alanyl-D-alanine ligase n=1 Tax=Ciceribacter sp. sgz301302 TaxID=3342379 RepID=UPI0035B8038F
MSYLWTMSDLVAALRGRPMGVLPAGITGISIDSRSIEPGQAFFAIRGDRVDGHDYAGVAIANGAALLVVSEGKLPALGRLSAPMIVVEDVLEAMVRLGCAARDRSRAKIIAVTGSVGKTTTKEMLRHVLSACGSVHASPASFNNHWGVPLTLCRLPENTDFGVFEIGMNHPDEIRPLVKMVRPHVAIITAIAPVHIGHFRDLDEIAAAKAEIFEGLAPGGHAVINRDTEKFTALELAAQAAGVETIHTFGSHARADFRMLEFAPSETGSVLWANIAGQTLEVPLGAPGRHIAENALAVLGAASLVGADLGRVAEALSTVSAEKGRGRRHRLSVGGGVATLIDESYNANPASMRATIALLRETAPGEGGRRIAVLGDMLELGALSADKHKGLLGPLLDAGVTDLWLAGAEMAVLRDAAEGSLNVTYRDTADALAAFAAASIAPGDVIMVKASNSLGFGRIVARLTETFPAAS